MKYKLAVATVGAVAAVGIGVLPAAASAATTGHHVGMAAPLGATAPATYKVSNAHCAAGKITFTAKQQENGLSGVQQFRQKAQLQEFTGHWVNRTAARSVTSTKFPNDARSFSFTRKWAASHAANGHSWRVKWQGLYLNGSGGVRYHSPVITVTC